MNCSKEKDELFKKKKDELFTEQCSVNIVKWLTVIIRTSDSEVLSKSR